MNFFHICRGRKSKRQVMHTLRATGPVDFNTSSSVKMKDYTVCVHVRFISLALHGSSCNLSSGSVSFKSYQWLGAPEMELLKSGECVVWSIYFISVCSYTSRKEKGNFKRMPIRDCTEAAVGQS